MKEKKRFMTLTMILTTDCNLNCSYCFCGKKYKKYMDIRAAKKYIDFFKQFSIGNPSICLFGGEPLLNLNIIEEICDYIKYIFNEHVVISITTNGTLINNEVMEIVRKYNIQVQVSIDGYSDTHNLSRKFYNGKGSWDLIINNIFNYFDTLPMIRLTYTPDTISDLSNNIEKLVGMGFFNIVFMPIDDSSWKNNLEQYIHEYEKICQFYYECFANNKGIYFIEFDNIIRSYIYNLSNSCKPGMLQISIDPEGNIFPCNRVNFTDTRLCLGTVEKGFDNRYNRLIKDIEKRDNICINCDLYNRCIECKIENYESTGKFELKNDYKCSMNKEKIYAIDRMAAKLYSNKISSFYSRFYT